MRRSDTWWAVALVALSAGAAVLAASDPPYRPLDALGIALAVASGLSLVWRRVAPVPVLAATSSLVIVNAAAGHPVAVVQWPVWIALFTCFALRGGRLRVVALAITLAGVAGWVLLDRGPLLTQELFWVAMVVTVAAVAGDAVSCRRSKAAAEQSRALAEERARLARELHDALGHAVNVMVMQAGVGKRVFDENPAFAREALGHIETVGREALVELDRLLAVMRPDDGGTPLDLTGLAQRIRAAGREIHVTTGDVSLTGSTARAAHRIVQEAVTNALRHTDDGPIDVTLTQVGDAVELEVVNGGRGLANMRERARMAGGSLEAGPIDGGFRVHATLPTPPP